MTTQLSDNKVGIARFSRQALTRAEATQWPSFTAPTAPTSVTQMAPSRTAVTCLTLKLTDAAAKGTVGPARPTRQARLAGPKAYAKACGREGTRGWATGPCQNKLRRRRTMKEYPAADNRQGLAKDCAVLPGQ